jgi:hypothetical protein
MGSTRWLNAPVQFAGSCAASMQVDASCAGILALRGALRKLANIR